MAITSTRTRTKTANGPNLNATVDAIGDIPLRIKALEMTYGLKGQLCWSMTSTHQLSGNTTVWNIGMTHVDGRDIVPLKSGANPGTLVNQVFREAARILKAEYGPGATTTAVNRRTA